MCTLLMCVPCPTRVLPTNKFCPFAVPGILIGFVASSLVLLQEGYIGADQNWEYLNRFIQPVG